MSEKELKMFDVDAQLDAVCLAKKELRSVRLPKIEPMLSLPGR